MAEIRELPKQQLVMVEYPGHVENVAAALETLGQIPPPVSANAQPNGEAAGISKDGTAETSEKGKADAAEADRDAPLLLDFRPQDAWSMPVHGHPHVTANLLLRVRRKRKKPSGTREQQASSKRQKTEEFSAEIVGTIERTYRWDDFQVVEDAKVLPSSLDYEKGDERRSRRQEKLLGHVLQVLPHADEEKQRATMQRYNEDYVARQKLREEHEKKRTSGPLPAACLPGANLPLLAVMPMSFSTRNYRPRDYGFRHNSCFDYHTAADGTVRISARRKQDRTHRLLVEIGVKEAVPAGPRKGSTASISGGGPEGEAGVRVTEEAVTEVAKASEETKKAIEWLRDVFEAESGPDAGRKVWTRQALAPRAPVAIAGHLSEALPFLAYKFRNGPYRSAWCPYGYDPRLSSSDAPYQVLDFRVTEEQQRRCVAHKTAVQVRINPLPKPGLNLQLDWDDVEPSPAAEAEVEEQPSETQVAEEEAAHSARVYTFQAPPTKNQMLYQMCDVDIVAVQRKLARTLPKFSEKTGWYPASVLQDIRTQMGRRLCEMLGMKTTETAKDSVPPELGEAPPLPQDVEDLLAQLQERDGSLQALLDDDDLMGVLEDSRRDEDFIDDEDDNQEEEDGIFTLLDDDDDDDDEEDDDSEDE